MVNNFTGSKDFSNKLVSALARNGITFVGTRAISASPDDRYFTDIGYVINDNGTQRIRRYSEIIELGKEVV